MIIDSHQHVFWHNRDDVGLVTDMDEQGIDLAWLLTWEVLPDEQEPNLFARHNPLNIDPQGCHLGLTFRDAVQARNRFPDRFVLGYCPHPMRGNAADLFEAAYHMHGVRVCGEWKCRMLFDDPRCIELFRRAGKLGCPVVLHIDPPYKPDPQTGEPTYQPRWRGGTVANVERAMQACPQTNFIGHAAGFWREISADADQSPENCPPGPVQAGGRLYRLFEQYPNLYADLSRSGVRALQRDMDHARRFILQFADRMLFGRDLYGHELSGVLDQLDLPDEALQKLYHRNASKLLSDLPESAVCSQ